jgi:hypothetical protein
MAKRIQNEDKSYSQAELIGVFNLERLTGNEKHPLMKEWITCSVALNANEQYLFDIILANSAEKIDGWHEEDLKMKFISFVLMLGHLSGNETDKFNTYFERTVSATVEGVFLKTKTDFMVAKGILDLPSTPYFHFQEWKRHRDPNGDPVGQLLEAFLVAQELNANNKPLYGCTITGKCWEFFVFKDRTYCISKMYDSTEADDLMHIIAVLRKFKYILETEILE